MRTNIVLDDHLLEQAFSLTGIKTKKELIFQALKEFVEHRQRLNIVDLKGVGGIDSDYDYKSLRAGQDKN